MVKELRISTECLEELVEQNMAFLIRTVSGFTGRYVSAEQDDEFSIALSAFAEAVERYEEDRGPFLPFAALVIRSRLQTHAEQQNRRDGEVSLDALTETGLDFAQPEPDPDLREEIDGFRRELSLFGLTLDQLADEAPRHRDTRDRAVGIARQSSRDGPIVDELYRKRKLPVRRVARLCSVTEKIVKGSRHFILSVILVFVKPFPLLIQWIESAR